MKTIRNAQLVTEAVWVLCPYCGEEQPSKNGSLLWTDEDFIGVEAHRDCVSCDKPIRIFKAKMVAF